MDLLKKKKDSFKNQDYYVTLEFKDWMVGARNKKLSPSKSVASIEAPSPQKTMRTERGNKGAANAVKQKSLEAS
jgi:hypothetical protein